MSDQHTQGRPLQAGEIPEGKLTALRVDDGYALFDEKWNRVADLLTFDPANARRLAAAWNICEGISTEHVEVIANVGGLMKIDEMLKNTEAQLADIKAMVDEEIMSTNASRKELAIARALLQEVSEQIGAITPFTIERDLGDRIRSFLEGK